MRTNDTTARPDSKFHDPRSAPPDATQTQGLRQGDDLHARASNGTDPRQ